MAKIAELKKTYDGEWLAISLSDDQPTEAVEGDLICHSPDRKEVWRKIQGDSRRVYVIYAGSPLEDGYAAAF